MIGSKSQITHNDCFSSQIKEILADEAARRVDDEASHQLARREQARHVRRSEAKIDQARIDRLYVRFVRMAIGITLSFGTVWGVWILTKAASTKGFSAPEPAAVQAHAHAQVFGWIGLFIMGVSYFLYPKMKQVRLRRPGLAELSFWLMSAGIIFRAIFQPFASHQFAGVVVAATAVLEIAAAIIFVRAIFMAFMDSTQRPHPSDYFILAAMGWFVVALALNFGGMLEIARTRNPVIPEGVNLARMNAEVFGFIATMILGVGSRLLPPLIGVRQISRRTGMVAAGIFAAGVAAKTFEVSQAGGSLLLVAGILLYVFSIGLYAPTRFNKDAWPSLRTWVRVAFFWLILGGAMMFGADAYEAITGQAAVHVWVGAYRHAVVVGFITTMVLGMALRTAPMFHGTPLFSRRLLLAAFWLLLVGNTSRVVFQTLTMTGHPAAYAIAGMSGYVELSALLCFGVNLFRTFLQPRKSGPFQVANIIAFPLPLIGGKNL